MLLPNGGRTITNPFIPCRLAGFRWEKSVEAEVKGRNDMTGLRPKDSSSVEQ